MDSDSSMSHIITKIVIIAILIFLSGFFSATETAFFSMNKIRIKSLANDGVKRAKKAMKLSDNMDSLLSTILIGNNLVNIATTAIATVLFISLIGEDLGATVATVVITLVVLIFGEITPKSLAKNTPESFAMFSAPILEVLVTVFKPLNWFVQMWQKLVYKFVKTPDDRGVTEEELITMVEEAHNDGEIDQNESELIRNAIEFDDIEVEDIYTSRVDLVAVEIDDSIEDINDQFEKGFSRLPVYQDTIDNIIGILNQKDFVEMKKTGQQLKNVMTEPIFVVPSMKISELLRTLQSRKSHMAIILDEFGGTVGIVTLEDILEELVGEIWDEHDTVVEPFVCIANDKYKVRSTADLDDMFELFGMEEDIDHSTVGGWVVEEFGKIPRVGEEFVYGPLKVCVSKRDPRRVTEVIVTKMFEQSDEDEDED
jgi:putative hemolysin